MEFKIKFLIIVLLLCLTPFFYSITSLNPLDDSDTSLNLSQSRTPYSVGGNVMLQAFFWDTPANWYLTINDTLPQIKNAGFDVIWLPPPSKGQSGGFSMGYDPYDYYDLGNYSQHGTTATRFGTTTELLSLIETAHKNDLSVLADLVLNHNSGGALQWNPNSNSNTYTDFSAVQSGRFLRGYNDFHPSSYEDSDEGIFGGFPDLCHENPYVHDELLTWGEWLRDDVKYDAWRFDYVKGYHPSMVQDWMSSIGGWGVAEYWDGSLVKVLQYLDSVNNSVSAFDFPLYYTLRDMCNGNGAYDLRNLANPSFQGVAGVRPFNSVTFVANHDTDEITSNKMMAYAYILTAEGYPSVFWNDWMDLRYQSQINVLLQVHNQFALGGTDILYSDENVYIAQRNGNPGCIVMLNDDTQWRGVTVQSKWMNQVLIDFTKRAENETVDQNGNVEIWAPPKGYTVFVPEITSENTSTLTSSTNTISSSGSEPITSSTSLSTDSSSVSSDQAFSGFEIIVIVNISMLLGIVRILRKKRSAKTLYKN
ncbi:MAG: alpha-amylase domain-containing protein [Promethearchaeota archaeon]|jgi:alpha-amylase